MPFITEEAVQTAFEAAPGGQLSVADLIAQFKDLLKDPEHKKQNRALFQQIIDRIAVVDENAPPENKALILKTAAFERVAEQERVLAKIVNVPDTALAPAPATGTGKVWQKPETPAAAVTAAAAEDVTAAAVTADDVGTATAAGGGGVAGGAGRDDLGTESSVTGGNEGADDADMARTLAPAQPPATEQTVGPGDIRDGDANYEEETDDVGQRDPPALVFKPGRSDLHHKLLTRPPATVAQAQAQPSSDDSTLSAQTVDMLSFRQKWRMAHLKSGTRHYLNNQGDLLGADQPSRKVWLRAAAVGGEKPYNLCVRLLREDPMVVTAKEAIGGYTALHWAAQRGDSPLVRIIASSTGYHINARTSGGYTPLHLACLHGHHGVQAQLREMGADERLMSNGGHTSKTLREHWMTAAMESDESDKCAWTDSEYTPYGEGKKKDRKFSSSLEEKFKNTGKIMKSAGSMLFRRSSMMHVDTAKKDKNNDRDESRVRVSKSDGDSGFKTPALPAKKKKGALGKLGKGMRSTFRKVTGKEKKRKDGTHDSPSTMRRSQSIEGLASPSKPTPVPSPINRWSQSLDNLNLGDFGEAVA